IALASVSAVAAGVMASKTMIEIAIARHVVIQAEHVDWRRVLDEPLELTLLGARVAQIGVKGMRAGHAAEQQVDAQPPPFVLERDLAGHAARAADASAVLRLHEKRVRIDLPDRPHRQRDRAALVQQRGDERTVIPAMRKPEAVEAGEPR